MNLSVNPFLKTFSCPQCGAPVKIRAAGVSLSVVCSACQSIVDTDDENHRILSAFQAKVPFTPTFALGTMGLIDKVKWQVVGFMLRADMASNFEWSEYLLFNPFHGYRWLVEQQGHWSFVKTTRSDVSRLSNRVSWDGQSFRLFQRGTAKVRFVIGEFYWQVTVGELVETEDYISPPLMLSSEGTKDEQVWSVCRYVTTDELGKAFHTKLPPPRGIAPNQPAPSSLGPENVWKTAKFALISLALLQLIFFMLASNKTVFAKDFTLTPGKAAIDFTSEPFELKGWPDNAELVVKTNLNQGWLDVEATLVNEAGDTFQFPLGVSYYSGVDGGESWSEGSNSNSAAISSIPNGTYKLVLDVEGEPHGDRMRATLSRGVDAFGNFILAAILILVPLALLYFRRYKFEVERWRDSDFSPYPQGSD